MAIIHMHTWARAIWLDLASGAERGLQPHRAVASAIADGYLAGVARRPEPQSDGVPPLSPALFLATIPGMYSVTAIGRPAVAKTAMMELSACF